MKLHVDNATEPTNKWRRHDKSQKSECNDRCANKSKTRVSRRQTTNRFMNKSRRRRRRRRRKCSTEPWMVRKKK